MSPLGILERAIVDTVSLTSHFFILSLVEILFLDWNVCSVVEPWMETFFQWNILYLHGNWCGREGVNRDWDLKQYPSAIAPCIGFIHVLDLCGSAIICQITDRLFSLESMLLSIFRINSLQEYHFVQKKVIFTRNIKILIYFLCRIKITFSWIK